MCACYWMFEPQIRWLKSVMVSAWTCNSFSWFQSAIVFTKNEFLNYCSVWAVGTIKLLVLLDKIWGYMVGKCLGLMCLVCFLGARRAGIDPLTVLYINFSLWSRCLLSNVSRLRIECVVLIQLNTLKHVHTQICAPWCVLSNAYGTPQITDGQLIWRCGVLVATMKWSAYFKDTTVLLQLCR